MVSHIFGRIFGHVLPCGMPFEAIPLSPSHAVGERKRKSCGVTSERKVPTRGFSAKKETMWRDLPAIFHNLAKKEGGWRNLSKESADSRIFGEKGNRVA